MTLSVLLLCVVAGLFVGVMAWNDWRFPWQPTEEEEQRREREQRRQERETRTSMCEFTMGRQIGRWNPQTESRDAYDARMQDWLNDIDAYCRD